MSVLSVGEVPTNKTLCFFSPLRGLSGLERSPGAQRARDHAKLMLFPLTELAEFTERIVGNQACFGLILGVLKSDQTATLWALSGLERSPGAQRARDHDNLTHAFVLVLD